MDKTDQEDEKLYKLIIRGEVSYPSFLSKEAVGLLSKMLEPKEEKRITAKDILNHNWLKTAPSHGFLLEP